MNTTTTHDPRTCGYCGRKHCDLCGCARCVPPVLTELAGLAAHEAAIAGVCSHGGHGWDGDTCSDIPTTPAWQWPKLDGCTCGEIGDTGAHRPGCPWAAA